MDAPATSSLGELDIPAGDVPPENIVGEKAWDYELGLTITQSISRSIYGINKCVHFLKFILGGHVILTQPRQGLQLFLQGNPLSKTIYLHTYLSLYLSVHLSITVSIFLSNCLSLSIYQSKSIYLYLLKFSLYLCFSLSICLSLSVFIFLFASVYFYPSIYPSTFLSIYRSILSISVYRSFYISTYLFVQTEIHIIFSSYIPMFPNPH